MKKAINVLIATLIMSNTIIAGVGYKSNENTKVTNENKPNTEAKTKENRVFAANDIQKEINEREIDTKSISTTLKGKEAHKNDIRNYTEDDIVLLARLIQSEALAEPYEGKLAVGNVVLKRMKTKKTNMEKVIYSRGQFEGSKSRLFNQYPSEDCIRASKEVLEGKVVINATHFVDLKYARPSWIYEFRYVGKIGGHSFYNCENNK